MCMHQVFIDVYIIYLQISSNIPSRHEYADYVSYLKLWTNVLFF